MHTIPVNSDLKSLMSLHTNYFMMTYMYLYIYIKFCTLVTLNGKKVRCFMTEKFVLYFLHDITFEKLLSVQLTLLVDF